MESNMNTRCAVCGKDGAKEWSSSSLTVFGRAHEGICFALLWESHYVAATGGSEHDHAFVLWQWQRRRAEVEGRLFTEPPPLSPADEETNAELERLGLCDVAKELT